jgi:hypothetical protein
MQPEAYDIDITLADGAYAATAYVAALATKGATERDEFDLDVKYGGPMSAAPRALGAAPRKIIPPVPTVGGVTCGPGCTENTCQGPQCGAVTSPEEGCPQATRMGNVTCQTCHGVSCDIATCGNTCATCWTCGDTCGCPTADTCAGHQTCNPTCYVTCNTGCGSCQQTCADTCECTVGTCQTCPGLGYLTCYTCGTCAQTCPDTCQGWTCDFPCTLTCGDTCGITCGNTCGVTCGNTCAIIGGGTCGITCADSCWGSCAEQNTCSDTCGCETDACETDGC